jgi:hypothetical protein
MPLYHEFDRIEGFFSWVVCIDAVYAEKVLPLYFLSSAFKNHFDFKNFNLFHNF